MGFYDDNDEICRGCGENYHPSALKNGYCIGCSDESFAVEDGRNYDDDDYY